MARSAVGLIHILLGAGLLLAVSPGEPAIKRPNLLDNIARPLRYSPDGTDLVIENGTESFNRPLYGGNTAFRVDAGDRPEFGLYLPGRGGVLRLGMRTGSGAKWLQDAGRIRAIYRSGSMLYRISDGLLDQAQIELTAIALYNTEGLIVKVGLVESNEPIELIWAYGGVNGQRGRRNVDIGAEDQPVSTWWQLRPEYCRDNQFVIEGNRFTLHSAHGQVFGLGPKGTQLAISDANYWHWLDQLLGHLGQPTSQPVIVGRFVITGDRPGWILLQRARPEDMDLEEVFRLAELQRSRIATRCIVETPDPFINAAASALNTATDAIWDEPSGTVMHGAVAWRSRLLGWRGPYANDAMGC
ncbi:MAG: DUF4450 domain-containing protein, partial [Sedimentisphaerales bacterium]|nr:DUF4450 domain-containing protein [Sedimentisphaerales bacterium]